MKIFNFLRGGRISKDNPTGIENLVTNTSNIEEVFTNYFNTNYWGSSESISGRGSEIDKTKFVRKIIDEVISDYEIQTFLDIPCGDFNWIKDTDIKSINYIGGDIVENLVHENNRKFRNKNISFSKLDITKDILPKVDLIFVRDCLVHLSYDNIFKALQNIKRSGSTYLLTTTFIGREVNCDIENGDWRPLNLEIEPFNLKFPLRIFGEKCPEDSNVYRDKSLSLYIINDLEI